MALIMDSLRYWVTDMHVDGFRFDLAPVLVRGYEAGQPSAFFEIIQQDPVLSKVKLIAEPWDVGPRRLPARPVPAGLVGVERSFPRLRPPVLARRSGPGARAGLAAVRLERHLRPAAGGRTYASVNFVTCHDGFTLTDLVSYERQAQRGQRRGQPRRHERQPQPQLGGGGRDRVGADPAAPRADEAQPAGHADVLPGRADDPRRRRDRSHPERATTTPYCQDNEISWVDWDVGETGTDLLDFTRDLIDDRGGQPDAAPAATSSPASP